MARFRRIPALIAVALLVVALSEGGAHLAARDPGLATSGAARLALAASGVGPGEGGIRWFS